MHLLRPDEYRRSVYAIDIDRLRSRGVEAIILDLDNTLVPWNEPNPSPPLLEWFAQAAKKGVRVCICSNNAGPRVKEFAERLGIPFVPRAVKPRRKGFRTAMAMLGVRPEETAVIGDQIFTDILGGNRAGAYTILVQPIDVREFFLTRHLTRPVERVLLRYLENRGLSVEE